VFSRFFSIQCLPEKLVKVFLTGLILPIAATGFAQTTIQARPADRFVDSIGVNVHMEYANTPYKHYATINQKLRELGMRHFRDEINDTHQPFVKELKDIGGLGYSLCGVIEGGNDYPGRRKRLEAGKVVPMIQNLLPTIEAVEGPNEPDDGGFVYGKKKVHYPWGAINESVDLWNIVKGSSKISALPVLVMSEGNARDFTQLAAITPPPIDYATYGNMHAYQNGDVGDHLLTNWYIPYSRDLTGKDALWTTEMGYHNNTHYLKDGEQQGVSQRASALYLPIAFLSGFDRGILRTFSYELIDEGNGSHITKGEDFYGLLNYDSTPKPAFTALKNLIALLREPGARDFDSGSLTITFSGAPATMRYTLLQKSTGAYYLAIWNDVKVYKVATKKKPGKDIYPKHVPISVTFSAPKTLTVYAPNDATGIHPTNAYTLSKTPRSIDLDLPPKVLLIKIVDDNQPSS
jgi:hypothetical protein